MHSSSDEALSKPMSVWHRTLSLWGSMKKKPLCSVAAAHGVSSENNQPNWISAVAALQNSDLVASGNLFLSRRLSSSFRKYTGRCF